VLYQEAIYRDGGEFEVDADLVRGVLRIPVGSQFHSGAGTFAGAAGAGERVTVRLAIVDPASLQVVARVPAGPDPHEIVASADGKAGLHLESMAVTTAL